MSVESFEPLGDRVLVEVEPAPETTESGLYLAPTDNQTTPKRGTVVATGDDCSHLNSQDTVLLRPRTGVEIEVRDTDNEYIVVEEELVLGRYRF